MSQLTGHEHGTTASSETDQHASAPDHHDRHAGTTSPSSGADGVVVASRGAESGIPFGSAAGRIARHCEQPVLTVP